MSLKGKEGTLNAILVTGTFLCIIASLLLSVLLCFMMVGSYGGDYSSIVVWFLAIITFYVLYLWVSVRDFQHG